MCVYQRELRLDLNSPPNRTVIVVMSSPAKCESTAHADARCAFLSIWATVKQPTVEQGWTQDLTVICRSWLSGAPDTVLSLQVWTGSRTQYNHVLYYCITLIQIWTHLYPHQSAPFSYHHLQCTSRASHSYHRHMSLQYSKNHSLSQHLQWGLFFVWLRVKNLEFLHRQGGVSFIDPGVKTSTHGCQINMTPNGQHPTWSSPFLASRQKFWHRVICAKKQLFSPCRLTLTTKVSTHKAGRIGSSTLVLQDLTKAYMHEWTWLPIKPQEQKMWWIVFGVFTCGATCLDWDWLCFSFTRNKIDHIISFVFSLCYNIWKSGTFLCYSVY